MFCHSYKTDKCKKLQFIHKLTASDTSKTAKITKRWYCPPAHRLNVNVLLSNITFFVIFAVLDVSLAVNLCIYCSFLHLSGLYEWQNIEYKHWLTTLCPNKNSELLRVHFEAFHYWTLIGSHQPCTMLPFSMILSTLTPISRSFCALMSNISIIVLIGMNQYKY